MHKLIAACPPLDSNSLYCNLLQCTHFARSGALAELSGKIVGFLSGYRLPESPDTLFVWQVAVDESARGTGVAEQMLRDILLRPDNGAVRYVHTTITEANAASWAFFRKFAERLGAPYKERVQFDRDVHLAGEHSTEFLLEIGPFDAVVA